MAEGDKGQAFSQSLTNESDAVPDKCCDVCVEDDKHVEAEGYCMDCSDYLCGECFKAHKRTKMSKGHTLQDKATMPREKTLTSAMARSSNKDKCTEPCEDHPDRIAEYYCQDHGHLGCSVCMTVNHRKCDNVDHIPDLAQGLLESKTYKQVTRDVDDLRSRSEQVITKTKENVAISETSSADTVQKVLDLKKDMDQIFDALLDDVIGKTNAIKSEDQQNMKLVAYIGQEVNENAEKIAADINVLKNSGKLYQLYVKILKLPDELKTLKSTLEEFETANTITKMSFAPSAGIESIIDGSVSLGEVYTHEQTAPRLTLNNDPKHITATKVQEIQVKTNNDSHTCWITSVSSLSDNTLIIVDNYNEKVKLIDTRSSEVTSELKMPTVPWDIALFSTTTAVVTLPDSQQITFVEITDKLTKKSSINVSGECRGIAVNDDKLIITFVTFGGLTKSVSIMNKSGKVLRSVTVRGVEWLSHVAYEPSNQRILLSDHARGREGPLIWIESDDTQTVAYKSPNLKGPRSIALGIDDTLLVAAGRSKTILVLNKEGALLNVLFETEGNPCGIDFCQKTNKLYVGFESGVGDVVHVYQLS